VCVAKKVSSLSGDIWRALQICKWATEFAKQEWIEKGKGDNILVSYQHVTKAFE